MTIDHVRILEQILAGVLTICEDRRYRDAELLTLLGSSWRSFYSQRRDCSLSNIMKEVKPVRQSDGTSIDEANSIHFDALTHPVSVRLLLLKGFQIKSQEHGFLIRINIGPENKYGIAHKDPRNCRKKKERLGLKKDGNTQGIYSAHSCPHRQTAVNPRGSSTFSKQQKKRFLFSSFLFLLF